MPKCDCSRAPVLTRVECERINLLLEMTGLDTCPQPPGADSLPPSAAAPPVFPQPFKLELVQACDVEDPDLRPYFWDCP